MADPKAGTSQVALRCVPGQREVIGSQCRQVHRHILLVILELMFLRHLGKQPGAGQYLHAAQQPYAQATRSAFLVIEAQGRRTSALLVITIHLHSRVVGADERRQLPVTAIGCQVVSQSTGHSPGFAVGITFLASVIHA
ncbi:hypothetical protein D3C73_1207880 [compost metagenome]